MKNNDKNQCDTNLCQYNSATRTRFYNGMLLTAEQLRAEQDYHREALKRVNRNLFGSGIVCGLEVEVQPRGLCVKISPGAALDCCGNLMEVCKCITVDLSKLCKDCFGADCFDPKDPDPKRYILTRYLVLRYAEKFTDPEQAFTQGDECSSGEKPNCEASRVREGYCIELLDYCPCAEKLEEPAESLLETLKRRKYEPRPGMSQAPSAGSGRLQASMSPAQSGQQLNQAQLSEGHKDCIDLPLPCVPCNCCENTNGVGLAKLTINCSESTITIDDCNECRRYVISPRLFSWLFSRLQSKSYLTEGMQDVYKGIGHLPTANAIATAMIFEDRMKRTDTTDKRFEDYKTRVDERVKRIDANEKRIHEYKRKVEDYTKKIAVNQTAIKECTRRIEEQDRKIDELQQKVEAKPTSKSPAKKPPSTTT